MPVWTYRRRHTTVRGLWVAHDRRAQNFGHRPILGLCPKQATSPLKPGYRRCSAVACANVVGFRAVGPASCHARDSGGVLGIPNQYFLVIAPLGVLVPLAWLVLAKKAYENPP